MREGRRVMMRLKGSLLLIIVVVDGCCTSWQCFLSSCRSRGSLAPKVAKPSCRTTVCVQALNFTFKMLPFCK